MVRMPRPNRASSARNALASLFALAGMTAFAVVAVPIPASSSIPGSNGLIAFVQKTNGSGDIWVANPDNSGQRQLTSGAADDTFPTISPNGAQIAFSSNRATGTSVYDIWVMGTDGSNLQQITDDSTFDTTPAWSPDGTKIAFEMGFGSAANVWVMDSDGSNRVKLNNKSGFDGEPAWSPNGATIAFASSRSGNNDIWTMNSSNGGALVQLTHKPGVDAYPNWGPGGNKIAFESDRSGNYDVWTINKNGDSPTQITHKSGFDGYPSYSPDNKQIAFDSDRSGGKHNVWYVRSNGVGTVHKVTATTTLDSSPAWQTLQPNQTLDVTDSTFPSPSGDLAFGTVLGWNFDAANTSAHDVTDGTGMHLFGSGLMPAGGKAAFGFFAAGTYAVDDTTTSQTVNVNVDPSVPPNGLAGDPIPVTWAVVPAPPGFVYDVQVTDCNGITTQWLTDQTDPSGQYTGALYEGSWGFSARLRETASGNASAYSPSAVINLTGTGCPP